jgi:integrase
MASRLVQASGECREMRGFVPYDFRHSFATILLSSNVTRLYVSKELGHKKPNTTLKYYARWIPSGQVHRVNVLDAANTVITPAATNPVAPASLPAVMC